MSVRDFNERSTVSFHADATIRRWSSALARGKIPDVNEEISHRNFRFTVLKKSNVGSGWSGAPLR